MNNFKTKVLRKMGYEGTYIYVLQYLYTFQYLFAWNNEVFRQEIIITPQWWSWRRWAWWLGYLEYPYTQDQLEQGEGIILSGAMKSIDELKKPAAKQQRKKAERHARVLRESKDECMWQVRANFEGDSMYWCITHKKGAPMEENKKPQKCTAGD